MPALAGSIVIVGQRPYSIRTRIKTHIANSVYCIFGVRDHIPLEQGLRRDTPALGAGIVEVRDHIPLEQGLRHLRNI